MEHPGLFVISLVFSNNTTVNGKNGPSCTWCQDSNSQPLDKESPPTTIRQSIRALQPPSATHTFYSTALSKTERV